MHKSKSSSIGIMVTEKSVAYLGQSRGNWDSSARTLLGI